MLEVAPLTRHRLAAASGCINPIRKVPDLHPSTSASSVDRVTPRHSRAVAGRCIRPCRRRRAVKLLGRSCLVRLANTCKDYGFSRCYDRRVLSPAIVVPHLERQPPWRLRRRRANLPRDGTSYNKRWLRSNLAWTLSSGKRKRRPGSRFLTPRM